MTELRTTPAQTVGPFFAIGLPWDDGPFVVDEGTPGAFTVAGRVLDGVGDPVPDALVEVWQADPDGRFDHPDDPRGAVSRPGFRGFGRSATDDDGRWSVRTVKPGPLPTPDGRTEAPHLNLSVLCRGVLVRLVTRVYFPDEDNSADPVLESLADAERATLVAAAVDAGYRFDIHLQGERETVFFEL
ncbi:protocatechuate 3,4-dioxygenase subunit alpha [Saccharothrix violaceirubra]|uniref:Protocatechuate 3,4-dioxygenase alpha subunit n=1 Tax=Saccharothrix violaceirubra TaxID=413306 RepID=A0A7W7T1E3_9PSEU|nr:protocatechuate 3,4-dioxygenase subunit alpha [Saccharothrix violaceirubra]MBB4964764.1 protocatechuate 3,4-dioxygenase alpha subunit [Saccharothrix violaceirubra]